MTRALQPGTTVAAALATAAARGLPRLDAQLLMLHALGRDRHDRAWLLSHDDAPLSEAEATAYDRALGRWCEGVPVAYLVGHKEFHGLEFAVDARVLVPRPDTEVLVDWALAALGERPAPRVLDLGTGSGAIALSIARGRPDAVVVAVDASAEALAVARENAVALGLTGVEFLRSDWFDQVTGDFDLVVSNPPYIAEGDAHLPALRHEPHAALVSGADGLTDLRRITAAAPAYLRPGAWLLLEHGWDQADAVRALLQVTGLQEAQSRRDLGGIERASGARRAAGG